jgi:hypothetical protein
MSGIIIAGDTSGSVALNAPAVAGANTLTLVAATGTLAPIVHGTSVSASGTSVDFTGIPSWAKRITVMFQGISTNGTSEMLIQLGSTTFQTTGYLSSGSRYNNGGGGTSSSTVGLLINSTIAAADVHHGNAYITNITGNAWTMNSLLGASSSQIITGAGSVTLSGVLDRIRITTVSGSQTFDAGSINIMYE